MVCVYSIVMQMKEKLNWRMTHGDKVGGNRKATPAANKISDLRYIYITDSLRRE